MRESEENSLQFAMRGGGAVERGDDAVLPDDAEDFDLNSDVEREHFNNIVALSGRVPSGCNFAVRRAIERRMEQRALQQDLEYLDCDLDD